MWTLLYLVVCLRPGGHFLVLSSVTLTKELSARLFCTIAASTRKKATRHHHKLVTYRTVQEKQSPGGPKHPSACTAEPARTLTGISNPDNTSRFLPLWLKTYQLKLSCTMARHHRRLLATCQPHMPYTGQGPTPADASTHKGHLPIDAVTATWASRLPSTAPTITAPHCEMT